MLEVRNLTAGYGDVPVLWDVSLSVPSNRIVALVGANGMGKTTLLRAISGVIRPSGGAVLLHGDDVTELPAHAVAAHGVAHVPEGRQLFPAMTVRENLVMGAYLPRAKAKRATGGCSAIETAAERLGELRMSAAHAETRDAAPRLQH